MEIRRLTANDTSIAAKLFNVMASVFEEPSEPLPADYIQNLLAKDSF